MDILCNCWVYEYTTIYKQRFSSPDLLICMSSLVILINTQYVVLISASLVRYSLLHFHLPHMAVHHLHRHRLHHLLLVQNFILNSRLGSSANSFLHRPFPFLPDWFHGLSDYLMILLCSAAGFVCMVC